MGMKPRKKAQPKKLEHCEFAAGILESWEYCDCSNCIPRQMAVLEKRLKAAKKREGAS